MDDDHDREVGTFITPQRPSMRLSSPTPQFRESAVILRSSSSQFEGTISFNADNASSESPFVVPAIIIQYRLSFETESHPCNHGQSPRLAPSIQGSRCQVNVVKTCSVNKAWSASCSSKDVLPKLRQSTSPSSDIKALRISSLYKGGSDLSSMREI